MLDQGKHVALLVVNWLKKKKKKKKQDEEQKKHVQHQKKLDRLLPLPSWLIGGGMIVLAHIHPDREQTTACACCSRRARAHGDDKSWK